MIVVERAGIELDYCIACRGLWFDQGELDLLADLTGMPHGVVDTFPRGEARTRRSCPRCPATLIDVAAGSVHIDACPHHHGYWFDHGELGSFVDNAAGRNPEMTPLTQFLGEVFTTSVTQPGENER